MQQEYDINSLYQEAQKRWLRPTEVYFILTKYQSLRLTHKAPQKPSSGSLFLFNKRVLKFFRKDGIDWRKKKDGRAVAEAHERLKVGSAEALNCYYAHGERNPNFQRRSYWMLDPTFEHIVLVHYRDITEGKNNGGQAVQFSPISSALTPSSGSGVFQNSTFNPFVAESSELHQRSYSPASIGVSLETAFRGNVVDSSAETSASSDLEVRQALQWLEEHLSTGDDNLKENEILFAQNQTTDSLGLREDEREIPLQARLANLHSKPENNKVEECHGAYIGTQNSSSSLFLAKKNSGGSGDVEDEESESWKNVLEKYETSLGLNYKEKASSSTVEVPINTQEDSHWRYGRHSDLSSLVQLQELDDPKFTSYSSGVALDISTEHNNMMFEQDLIEVFQAPPTVASKHKFTIREISPEWGYATEGTKVVIVGYFLCDPTETTWTCMFGDTEVPLQIIQEGVLRCEAPRHHPGKVSLCITSRDQISCSEIKEFEYRDKTVPDSPQCNLSQLSEALKSPDELLLLVEFVQMLLTDSPCDKRDNTELGLQNLSRGLNADDGLWSRVMDSIREGSGTAYGTVDWLLQELLKDKLHLWLSSKFRAGNPMQCSLSKKEQGLVHLVAGLGYEWALSPIISHGVSVNFRDSKGWTPLHWAARFGREKMVSALIASGASAGAVTDPNSQDPIGETPASVAAFYGHKGLAGYLAELDLTSHLLSLTLEETENSKDSAKVQAEMTMNSILKPNVVTNEDQVLLAQTLEAVRNAAQAAARIQAAFRLHSFKKRQQREAAAATAYLEHLDEYGIHYGDVRRVSSTSELARRTSAALSIQKNYRGRRDRKKYLALRRKVVKIQAHVRGYHTRKHYKVICRTVRILDRLVLRWRRKGAGLRGYRKDTESSDENEDEDFLKVFRKQKVDTAVNAAFSRVLSMVRSPDARQQYHRMLEKYWETKAEAENVGTGETLASGDDGLLDLSLIDDVDMDLLLW